MTRYRIDLEYDGTDFSGWQIQPGSRTVQGEVEAALARLLGAPARVTGAGRTDRGCHAAGQVAHFDDFKGALTRAQIARGLAALLPEDVRVRALTVAPEGFHARYSASRRAYQYLIARRRSARTRRLAWQLGERLRLDALREASACLLGEHDFRGYSVSMTEESSGREPLAGDSAGREPLAGDSPVRGAGGAKAGRCRVERADWEIGAGSYRFTIVADRFLTRMVRLLVGALVEVGRGRVDPSEVADRLDRPVRDPRPAAAPAAGLCLAWVRYGGRET